MSTKKGLFNEINSTRPVQKLLNLSEPFYYDLIPGAKLKIFALY